MTSVTVYQSDWGSVTIISPAMCSYLRGIERDCAGDGRKREVRSAREERAKIEAALEAVAWLQYKTGLKPWELLVEHP